MSKITKLERYQAIENYIKQPEINYDLDKINYNEIARTINWNVNSVCRYVKIILEKRLQQNDKCSCCNNCRCAN